MKIVRYVIALIFTMLPLFGWAQEVDMADTFRQEGKIYVVVTIAAVILIGIFVYLFMLDKKISKIEKQLKK